MTRAAMTDSVWTLSTGGCAPSLRWLRPGAERLEGRSLLDAEEADDRWPGCVSGHLAHLSSLDLPVDRSVHDHGWATGLQPSERTLMSA